MNKIKIAVSGRSGCGNTTISKLAAENLGLDFINFTFRSLAAERDVDLKKIMELAAQDDSWDREVDTRQVKLARESKGCVLGSRLAVWMLKEADLKVYLKAKPEVRAMRIFNREGGNLDEIAAFTAERDKQDHGRYLRIYNIDTDNFDFVDMIIDTDNLTPAEIAGAIAKKAQEIKCI
ncbi:MAG: cytidylate kinase family protein [Treponema sp.]|nr:cytidylate kinase family protein [Treponema sp.]